jgi:hypothetical protein
MIDLEKFNIKPCDMTDIISETSRFLFHITLVHIATYLIEGREEFFNAIIIKTLFVTAIAVILYHVTIKKIIEPKLKNVRTVCDNNNFNKKFDNKTNNKDIKHKKDKKDKK